VTKVKYHPTPLKTLHDVEMKDAAEKELDELYKSSQALEAEVALPDKQSNVPDLEEKRSQVNLKISAKGKCTCASVTCASASRASSASTSRAAPKTTAAQRQRWAVLVP